MSTAEVPPIISGSNFGNAEEKGFRDGVGPQKMSLEKKKVRCALSDRAARVLEIAILTTVIIFVMALLSIPSMLYFATQVSVACIYAKIMLTLTRKAVYLMSVFA